MGWGCASAAYPANIGAGAARVILETDGHATVKIAAHDIGTGSHTIIAQTASERLGIAIENIVVQLGDTDLPPGGLAAGSCHGSGIVNAVALACEQIRDRVSRAAAASNGPLAGRDPAAMRLQAERVIAAEGTSEKLTDALSRRGQRGGRSLCGKCAEGTLTGAGPWLTLSSPAASIPRSTSARASMPAL